MPSAILTMNSSISERSPQGIAVDWERVVYVIDEGNSRVQVFDADGRFLAKLGITGARVVAVDAAGNVYVLSWGLVQVFAPVR